MQAASLEEPFKFTPSSTIVSAQADTLERQTRHEISQLVAEISELSRSSLAPAKFWLEFATRLLRALAAEGVVIWSATTGNPLKPIARVGNYTDQNVDAVRQSIHLRLLADIVCNSRPVLVPPSPDENEGVRNPLDYWAGIVPLESGDRQSFAVEALLDDVGGPSAQLGYLKFIAQMSDFAGEYLRTSSLNNLKRQRGRWETWDRALAQINRAATVADVQRRTVDGAAEVLNLPRVSLLERTRFRWRLVASNGIDSPDPRGAAGLWLTEVVKHQAATEFKISPDLASCDNPTNLAVLTVVPVYWPDDTAEQLTRLIQTKLFGSIDKVETSADPKSRRKTAPIAALVFQADSTHDWDDDQQLIAQAIARGASGAMRATELAASLPWLGAWLLRRGRQHNWQRPLIITGLSLIAIAVLAMIPIPLRVLAPATLESASVSVIQAPRDGIVQTMLVDHAQQVTNQTPLFEIIDPALDRLEEQWLGQQAVLIKRNSELQRSLIRGEEPNRRTQWEAEQAEVVTELAAIARQLHWIALQRANLTVTSPRNGQVDGWDVRQQFLGRQVQRGEPLMRVFDPDGNWRVRTEIPQSRLDHVVAALATNEKLSVSIVLRSFPDQPLCGTLTRLGPTTAAGQSGLPVGWSDVEIITADLPLKQCGAAATVAISCGHRSLGYVLFQDLIRAATGWWKLWTA